MTSSHKSLLVDIETFSATSLPDCGVYRYCQDPDFTILLIAYAFDDEPVELVDVACGEDVPQEFLDALSDPGILKLAYNANFERTCMGRFFNRPMPPEQWQDIMIHAAYLGLPRSLAGVCDALGLGEDQGKMKEGKDLIRYFCLPCKPTKTNGGRTRNLPTHAPDKWEIFRQYCIRDVESERTVERRLSSHPVPESEWEIWRVDQAINDRGVMIDTRLARMAVAMSEANNKQLTEEAVRLTGLENPSSVAQLKRWLDENDEKKCDSLSKAYVSDRLKELPEGTVKRVLTIRKETGKSSVSKYEAMLRSVCEDGRVRGTLQHYGANRTGRWCLTGDHEVLTESGWVRLDEWTGGMIACWNPNGEVVSFQRANAVSFPYNGEMYFYRDKRISQISTPDHKMWVQRRRGAPWSAETVESLGANRPCIPFTGTRLYTPSREHDRLRVLVMTQADGCYTADGRLRLKFKKQRKIERCRQLLRRAGLCFTEQSYGDGSTGFVIPKRALPLWLLMFKNKTFGPWLFDQSADVFFEELELWDGYRAGPNSIQYCTCNKQNADMVQAFAHLSGRAALIKEKHADHPVWNACYNVDIWLSPGNCHELRDKPERFIYDGRVYCAETPTGYFLVRRCGRVWVTGNSGRLVQTQNLPQNHIEDLDIARNLVRDGDLEFVRLCYGDVNDTLSQLIRTAIIPRDGCLFAVSDFSAIEARLLAWLAGEQWKLDVFANGGDIYCETASQMFGVPVVKHGQNAELRQKGKIATLALGYGGTVGAMVNMGAVRMGIPEEDLPEIVDRWRAASPRTVELWHRIDSAAMAATKYHEWSEDLGYGLRIGYEDGLMIIELPSGRRLHYVKPRIGTNKFGREAVTYMGGTGWTRIETFGGKLTENIIQAIGRDCLARAMLRVSGRYPIVMHVHDEMIAEVPLEEANEALQYMNEVMADPIPWAPGLILRGDGYLCDYYRKD